METRRWTNPSQPQTLRYAVFLLYMMAAFDLLLLRGGDLFTLGALVLGVAGGLGIASEQRWGYLAGVASMSLRVLPLLLWVLDQGVAEILNVGLLIDAVFPVAGLVLLLHPQSREYERIWFH